MISQKDFNLDMNSYISKRRKTSPLKTSKKSKVTVEEFNEEMENFSSKKSIFGKMMGYIAGEEEEEYEELESEAGPRQNIFSKVKSWLHTENVDEEDMEEPPNLVNEDIKDVLKIQNKWLMRLPTKIIREFKNSEDYQVYKANLEKYNLIKVKE